MNSRQSKGFTLIELLVVIAIIGILSTVVLASLNAARTKAKDTNRVQELKQIQIALELYYNTYGEYPKSSSPQWDYYNWTTECEHSTFLIPKLIDGGFLTHIKDPEPCPGHWGYTYGSDGVNYKLLAHTNSALLTLQPFIDPAQDQGGDPCVLDGPGSDPNSGAGEWNEHFGVWTAGATCWIEMDQNNPLPGE